MSCPLDWVNYSSFFLAFLLANVLRISYHLAPLFPLYFTMDIYNQESLSNCSVWFVSFKGIDKSSSYNLWEEMTVFIFYSGTLYLQETTEVADRMLLIAFTQLRLEMGPYRIIPHTLLLIPACEPDPRSSGVSHEIKFL